MTAEQKIVPCIWFNKDADEAVSFYLSTFGDSAECAELQRSHYPTEGLEEFQSDMAGEPLTIEFSLGGVRLTALNAGSEFRPTPMLSFIVNFDPSRDKHAGAHIDEVWERLSEGGEVLIDIGPQPYSPRYGWVQDRYGVSWQLMQTDPDGEPRPFLIPTFLFANANANRASEAIEFYASLFPDTRIGMLARNPEANEDAAAGSLMFGEFAVGEQWFAAMDAPRPQDYDFTEGISLQVECADQLEIDRLWDELSRVPEAEQCGWCKDQFGVSWQVVPANMDQLMTPENWSTMMRMGKIEIAQFS